MTEFCDKSVLNIFASQNYLVIYLVFFFIIIFLIYFFFTGFVCWHLSICAQTSSKFSQRVKTSFGVHLGKDTSC